MKMTNKNTRWGFTLMELLVVVLIIGILAAVALPQYQKAVLKSRFSSLMPLGKALCDGNEAYYLEHGSYATDKDKLDVTNQNPDVEITLGSEEQRAFVQLTREDINNNLVLYQKQSPNFPEEIHCEALKDNVFANWLCKDALHGRFIEGSLSKGYLTYIVKGAGKGKLVTYKEKMIELLGEMGKQYEQFYSAHGRYPTTWEEAGFVCPQDALKCRLGGWYPRIQIDYTENSSIGYIANVKGYSLASTRGKVVCTYNSQGTRAEAEAVCGTLGTLVTEGKIPSYGYIYVMN